MNDRLVRIDVPARGTLVLTGPDGTVRYDLELDPPQYRDRVLFNGVEVRVQMPQIRGNHHIYTLDVLHGRFLTPEGNEVSRIKVHHRRGRGDVWLTHNKERSVAAESSSSESQPLPSRIEAFNRRYPHWRNQIG